MRLVIPLIIVTFALASSYSDDAVPTDPQPRWWRGNIHTHSLWSDGDDFPDMISEWYRTHDYNFLAISDHNVISQGQRWMKRQAIEDRGGAKVLDKYLERFGTDWVETRTMADSDQVEVRLKPFNEYRALLEHRGQFILIPGEEISDSVGGKPVHMNVTNVQEVIEPLGGETVAKAIEANLRAVEVQAKKLGREMIVHLNHPNFGYAITAEDLAEVVSERFFEVYNGHQAVNHLGDEKHPGIESMWDVANTIRIARYGAAPLLGVATDDSHNYHGGDNSPGRGWIMVRSRHLTPESLIRAMRSGDFYASSGVALSETTFDQETKRFSVQIATVAGVTYETKFIGSRKSEIGSDPMQLDLERAGVVLHSSQGPKATYQLSGDELYVRAVVISDKPHPNPSFAKQMETAWTQPVGWTGDTLKK